MRPAEYTTHAHEKLCRSCLLPGGGRAGQARPLHCQLTPSASPAQMHTHTHTEGTAPHSHSHYHQHHPTHLQMASTAASWSGSTGPLLEKSKRSLQRHAHTHTHTCSTHMTTRAQPYQGCTRALHHGQGPKPRSGQPMLPRRTPPAAFTQASSYAPPPPYYESLSPLARTCRNTCKIHPLPYPLSH